MRVRLLLALLAKVDPQNLVLADAAGNLLFLNDRPGMHQSLDEPELASLSEEDWRFLRALRIR